MTAYQPDKRAKRNPLALRLQVGQEGWRWIAAGVIVAVFALTSPYFLSQSNWVNTSVYASEVLLLALGELLVILTAGIDLSVGATLGFADVLATLVVNRVSHSTWEAAALGIAVAVIAGGTVGLINGLVITRLKVTPFITTLGLLGIISGASLVVVNGSDVPVVSSAIGNIGSAVWLGWLGVPVAVSVFVTLLIMIALRSTSSGVYLAAVGSSAVASTRAGLKVDRILLQAYVVCGMLAGLAGFLHMTRFQEGSPTAGTNAELNAIAAVIIGGANLFGGRGGVGAAVLGTVIISVLVTGLALMGIQPYWETIATGLVIVIAVAVQQVVPHK